MHTGIKLAVFLLRVFQISTWSSDCFCFPKGRIVLLCNEQQQEVNGLLIFFNRQLIFEYEYTNSMHLCFPIAKTPSQYLKIEACRAIVKYDR